MTFVEEPSITPAVQEMYDADVARSGYVSGPTRVWAHQPRTHAAYAKALDAARAGLTPRERGILGLAMASALGDAPGSLLWGTKLAADADESVAVDVLGGFDDALTATEAALATWARSVTRDPCSVEPEEVEALRQAGFDDEQIVSLTIYVAIRIAVATVNGALGVAPDAELMRDVPSAVRHAVTWGRRPAKS